MKANLMIQGTGSSAGKSLLTTAFCRIFKNEGYKTAPFKSQNMTRNVTVLDDGKKIASSQIVQAEAAGAEPSSIMNPILLVPNSETGSMVIVKGEDTENTDAKKYHDKKKELIPAVKESYNALEKENDVIVIEGAGSPAEINLRENDFVNMGLAHMVDAPVILVGDIEKGGVFASIYGTVKIMDMEDGDRIKGFIINKFRGKKEILMPGIYELEERLNIPCLGIIPFENFDIEEEDSYYSGKAGEKIADIELREKEYDRLAKFVEDNTNLKKIKEIMGL